MLGERIFVRAARFHRGVGITQKPITVALCAISVISQRPTTTLPRNCGFLMLDHVFLWKRSKNEGIAKQLTYLIRFQWDDAFSWVAWLVQPKPVDGDLSCREALRLSKTTEGQTSLTGLTGSGHSLLVPMGTRLGR